MKLSEEIKTNKFINEHHKAQLNILFTSNWISAATGKIFKQYDISPEQYNVLRILRGSYPMKRCLKEITERMLDKNSNTSRIIKKLSSKQLIEVVGHEADKRFYQIGISESGQKLLKKIDLAFDKSPPIEFKLTNDEAIQLNELLDKLRS